MLRIIQWTPMLFRITAKLFSINWRTLYNLVFTECLPLCIPPFLPTAPSFSLSPQNICFQFILPNKLTLDLWLMVPSHHSSLSSNVTSSRRPSWTILFQMVLPLRSLPISLPYFLLSTVLIIIWNLIIHLFYFYFFL